MTWYRGYVLERGRWCRVVGCQARDEQAAWVKLIVATPLARPWERRVVAEKP